MQVGEGVGKEGDTEAKMGSRLWAVNTEPNVGLELTNWETMTWAKVRCLSNWAIQVPLNNPILKWSKDLRDISPKKLHKWKISIWGIIQHQLSRENGKLKQWCISVHLLGWPNSRTLVTPNAGENMLQKKPLFITGGNIKQYSRYWKQFGSLLQT